jgi:3',5'-cyclic AMP phosphodiesterase CpdA
MPVTLPPISRRSFLRGALAAAGGVALGSSFAWGEVRPAADHLALLSDIHLDANRETIVRKSYNVWEQFSQCRDAILELPDKPACVLINGDCALSRGRPEDYATVVAGVAPFREAGLPVHLALGNHDSRENLLKAIPKDDRRVEALADRRVMVLSLAHADWYVLDSLDKTNITPGVLGAEQLDWLKASLDAHADRPAIIMVHHQPDVRPLARVSGLTDTAALFELLTPRPQVKALLFGHTHVWKRYKLDGLHCINLPTSAYPFNPTEPVGWVDAHVSPGNLRLQLHTITPDHPNDKEVVNLLWR